MSDPIDPASPPSVTVWLEVLGLGQYAAAFKENHVTLAMLLEMTADELKECGVTSFGHRKTLLAEFAKLAAKPPPPAPAKPGQAAPRAAPPPPARARIDPVQPLPAPLASDDQEASVPATRTVRPPRTRPEDQPAPLAVKVSPIAHPKRPPSQSPAARRLGFWGRLAASKFLFISIVAHLLFGVGATYFIVQRIQSKRKVTFQSGPASANPSKRALEHKVSMAQKKKTGGAPPQAKRIVSTGIAKVSLPDLPTIPTASTVVPGMMAGMGGAGFGAGMGFGSGSGMGSGMGGGVGGGGMTLFGFRSGGGGLAGHFYDLKQTRDGKPTQIDANKFREVLTACLASGGAGDALAPYFKAPTTLYAPQLFTPSILAEEGPKAFGVEKNVKKGGFISAVYKGKVVAPKTGRFRFVGMGDNVLAIRFAGRIVLDNGSLHIGGTRPAEGYHYTLKWASQAMGDRYYAGAVAGHGQGEIFEVQAGQAYDMAVIWGELDGGLSLLQVLIEEIGENYAKDARGNPVLPVFRMGNATLPKGDGLPPTQNNAPVWRAVGGNSLLDALKR